MKIRQQKIKFIFLLGFLFFQICQILAQSEKHYIADIQQYSIKEGLLHQSINDIHQDSRGFIWSVTKYGLSRFDGKHFQSLTKEKNGLPSSYIRSITEDKNGWLWIFSDDDNKAWTDFTKPIHLTVVNIYSLEVKSAETHLGQKLPFDISQILQIEFETDGTIIFMTFDDAYYEYRPKSGFKKFETPSLASFVITKNNTFLGVTKDFSYQEMDRKGNVLRKHRFPGKLQEGVFFQDARILKNIKINGEYLFYGFSIDAQNVLFTSSKSEPLPTIALPEGINLLRESYKGNLFYDESKDWFWFCEKDRFFVFSMKNGLIYDFANHLILSKSFINDVIFTEKIAWVATSNGLFKIKLTQNPFIAYLKTPENSKETPNACRGMITINDTLYVNVSHNKKPQLIDLKTGATTSLVFPKSQIDLGYPQVLYRDKKDNLWFTFYDAMRYNLNTKTTTDFIKDKSIFSSFWSIYEEENGKLWFGGDLGIGSLTATQKAIEIFEAKPPFEALNEQTVYQFMELSPDKVLLGTVGGFYELNPKQNKIIKRYWTGGKGDEYFPYNKIYHFHKDKNGVFWVATDGNGLIRWERKKGKNSYKTFTVADGLSSNTIYAVYEDNANNLWLPSDYGIIKFNKLSHNCIAYLPEDGVAQAEFNRISHYQAFDGKLYFGGVNGVTAFYPSDLTDTSSVSDVPLEIVEFLQYSVKANKIINKTTEVIQSKNIILQPGERFFDLKFALLNFENSSLIRYAYRIEGVDKDWNYTKENNIRISGLPYGNHQLRVRGQSPNGQFSTNEILLKIQVIRPFYLRWWFLLLCFSAIIISVYTWYQWRTKQLMAYQSALEQEVKIRTKQIEKDKTTIEAQTTELKNLDKLKSRFFANISHELRTPLTLILAPVKELLQQSNLDNKAVVNLTLIEKNTQRLQQMVNEILDLSKLEGGQMTAEFGATNWYSFLKQIYTSFKTLADFKKINYQLIYQDSESLNVLLDQKRVETIFNNLLSNAFKFTLPEGQVTIKSGILKNHIWFEVYDTGRGISNEDLPNIFNRFYQTKDKNQAAEGGTGIGLALSKEIINLLKGNIEVKSEVGKYTVFRVELPFEEVYEEVVVQVDELADHALNNVMLLSVEEEVEIVNLADNTILLVEDNHDLSLFIKTILKEYYHVITAFNGQEALEKLAEHPNIQLVVSDVMMPIIDGFQLLEKLKTSEKYRKLPVIMLTARAALRDKLKALRIGVDDYLTKPFIKEELIARIQNLLQNAEGRRAALEETENLDGNLSDATEIYDETEEWLDNLERVILKNISISEFTIDDIATEMFMSKRQLYRKIKAHIGLTPLQYVKAFKLSYARDLLENHRVNSVKAAAYAIGYPNSVYFKREFKKAFGRLPSDYLAT